MRRRTFILTGSASLLALPVLNLIDWRTTMAATGTDIEQLQTNWQDFLPEGAELPSADTPIDAGKNEWRERLDADAFEVLFRHGTERAGSSPLDREKREGVFICRACELPLFTSAMKFDSGTGWPSFFTSIPGHLGTSTDFKMILPRTEYHCVRCSGHQGHVFKDGPPPTNQRFCNNGVALSFLPKAGTEAG